MANSNARKSQYCESGGEMIDLTETESKKKLIPGDEEEFF